MATINKFIPSRSKVGIAVLLFFLIAGPYGLYNTGLYHDWDWVFVLILISYIVAIYLMYRYYVLANHEYVKLDSNGDGYVEVKLMGLFRPKVTVRRDLVNVKSIKITEISEGDDMKYLKFYDGDELYLPTDFDNKLEESIIKWFRENYNKELQIELDGFRRVNWKAISWKKINWKKIIKKER